MSTKKITQDEFIKRCKNTDVKTSDQTRDKFNHLDHILSIVDGFNNDISPEIVGSIYNLRIITAKENQTKSYKSDQTPEQLLEAYFA